MQSVLINLFILFLKKNPFIFQASAKPKVKTEVLTSETSPGKENMENAQIEDKKV